MSTSDTKPPSQRSRKVYHILLQQTFSHRRRPHKYAEEPACIYPQSTALAITLPSLIDGMRSLKACVWLLGRLVSLEMRTILDVAMFAIGKYGNDNDADDVEAHKDDAAPELLSLELLLGRTIDLGVPIYVVPAGHDDKVRDQSSSPLRYPLLRFFGNLVGRSRDHDEGSRPVQQDERSTEEQFVDIPPVPVETKISSRLRRYSFASPMDAALEKGILPTVVEEDEGL
ncbi:MAG: hypothetical protein M1818_005765 [Claussenomyces sp. TS43310]|nr:MAG: hypothetical protein M1818_005765 [Claussenomyces sp. TS43310]